MKKLVSLLLSMTFVVSALSVASISSYAEDETTVETIEESTEVITIDVAEILGDEYSDEIIAEIEEEYESLVETYEERGLFNLDVSKDVLVACIKLSAFVKERKSEEPKMYRYVTSCGLDYDYDGSSVIVNIGGCGGFGDGKAIAEIKAFMEENNIDESLVSMIATEEWIIFEDDETTESTETTTESETLDELLVTEDTGVRELEYGDINGDTTVSIGDAVLLNKYLVGSAIISDDLKTTADVNVDGTIDATDASLVLGYCVQAVESLPYVE